MRKNRRRWWVAACSLMALAGLLAAGGPPRAHAGAAVVVDDGNNLRLKGGKDYRQAPVIEVLNKGDYVQRWKVEGGWAQVETPEGLVGWVNARCLREVPDTLTPQVLKGDLRTRLADFLQRLRTATLGRQFQGLSPLLSPQGLAIERRLFKDAAKVPGEQSKEVVSLWYATDVSLTYGSAWQLLMQGTEPPKETAYWDEAADAYRLGQPAKGKEGFRLSKEGPLLPAHLQALALAASAFFIDGYPSKLAGFSEPESYLEDPASQPLALVYKVGKDRYLLKPLKGVGLIMVVTGEEGEGLRLRALYTQSP